MSDVTRILSAIDQGDLAAADQLLPIVYQELRKLAAQKLSNEKPGQTLQATALVHDAWIRLEDRGHQLNFLLEPSPLGIWKQQASPRLFSADWLTNEASCKQLKSCPIRTLIGDSLSKGVSTGGSPRKTLA